MTDYKHYIIKKPTEASDPFIKRNLIGQGLAVVGFSLVVGVIGLVTSYTRATAQSVTLQTMSGEDIHYITNQIDTILLERDNLSQKQLDSLDNILTYINE